MVSARRGESELVQASSTLGDRLLLRIVQATAIVTPLTVTAGRDSFRMPKELVVEAGAIALVAAMAIVALLWRTDAAELIRARRRAALLVAAIVGWTAIATVFSTQRMLSAWSLGWVAACCVLCLGTLALSQTTTVWAVVVGLAPAVLNAALGVLQGRRIWNPFVFPPDAPARLQITGLVGNPNDLGSYLVLPAVAAIALAIAVRGRARLWPAAAAVIMACGIAVTDTLTAEIALGAALCALLILTPRRIALRAILVAAVVIVVAGALQIGPMRRVSNVWHLFREGKYFELTSFRTQPYYVALEMIKDHPIVGVGPDCFGFWYVPYRILVSERHPEFFNAVENFRETHNDHLQVAAVAGLPAYALFIVSIVMLARLSRIRGDDGDVRRRFVHSFALPSAVAFATLTLAQFPLETAASATTIFYFAGLTVAWSTDL
jgi:O-antigen ligase